MLLQEGQRPVTEVGTRLDAEARHLSGGDRPYPMEPRDGQALHPGGSHIGRHGELAVGLALIRCKFCQELVIGDARRRRETGFRSEEHTSELQSLMRISYAGFCLKK